MYRRSDRILQEIKIDLDSPRKKVGNLSGGQRQAIAVGRAIFWGTKFVILDEPTSALTPLETEKLLASIQAMADDEQVAGGALQGIAVAHQDGVVDTLGAAERSAKSPSPTTTVSLSMKRGA